MSAALRMLVLLSCVFLVGMQGLTGQQDNIVSAAVTSSEDGSQTLRGRRKASRALDLKFGGRHLDWTLSHAALKSGGFLIAGNTLIKSVQRIEGWILRLDAKGQRVFERRLTNRKWTEINCIALTADGGFVVGGRVLAEDGLNGWIARFDRQGTLLFEKTFGKKGDDWVNGVALMPDGGYVVTGFNGSNGKKAGNGWVFRLDQTGQLVWEKIFGDGLGVVGVNSVAARRDGAIIVAGEINKKGDLTSRGWVAVLQRDGSVKFEKRYGTRKKNWVKSVVVTRDGGFALTGSTQSDGKTGEYDAWVFKLNSEGGVLWEKSFGGVGNDWANDILQHPEGGFAVAGWTDARGAKKIDAVVRRLNAKGELIWQSRFGGAEIDRIYSIVLLDDGGLSVAGVTQSKGARGKDAWMVTIPVEQMPLE